MYSQQQQSQYKFNWYQSSSKIVISIVKRGAATEDCRLEYRSESNSLRVLWRDEVIFSSTLHARVHSQNMSLACTPSKVEVTLEKLVNERWPELSPTAAAESPNASFSTSTKSNDWDRLAKEVEEEEEKSTEGVDRLFQQIYRDADDDVRKAMMKSFTESCGTVLSTNWSEIKSKKIEVKPPSDMEYKKYEL